MDFIGVLFAMQPLKSAGKVCIGMLFLLASPLATQRNLRLIVPCLTASFGSNVYACEDCRLAHDPVFAPHFAIYP